MSARHILGGVVAALIIAALIVACDATATAMHREYTRTWPYAVVAR